MNTNMLAIVKQIIAEQGEGILDDPQRLKAFFADLARDEPKPYKNVFIKCVELKFMQMLKDVAPPDRDEGKKALAKRLHEEEGFDAGLCEEAVELLVKVLFEQEQPQEKNGCKNCGKELQAGWAVCPFCGTAVIAVNAPVIQANSAHSSSSWDNGDVIEAVKLESKAEPSSKKCSSEDGAVNVKKNYGSVSGDFEGKKILVKNTLLGSALYVDKQCVGSITGSTTIPSGLLVIEAKYMFTSGEKTIQVYQKPGFFGTAKFKVCIDGEFIFGHFD